MNHIYTAGSPGQGEVHIGLTRSGRFTAQDDALFWAVGNSFANKSSPDVRSQTKAPGTKASKGTSFADINLLSI